MGPYLLVHTALVGFFGFAAIYHLILWWTSKGPRLIGIFGIDCAVRTGLSLAVVHVITSTTPAEAYAAMVMRVVFIFLQPMVWPWCIALLTGLRIRKYLIAMTGFFLCLCLVHLFLHHLNPPVVALQRITLPWGEAVSNPVLGKPGWWFGPLYFLGITIEAFGFYCGCRVWRRDRLAGGLILASITLRVATHVLLVLKGFGVIHIPFFGMIDQVLWVAVIAVLIARRNLRTDESLRQSEARYRQLVENSPFCIHEYDTSGRYSSINAAGLKMLGLNGAEQILGKHYLHVVPPSDRHRIEQLYNQAGSDEALSFELPLDNGKTLTSSFIPLADGTIMGISQDITQRRQAEASLRDSQDRLQLAVRASHLGFWESNVETGVVLYSTEWKRQLGYEEHEISSRYQEWESRLHADDREWVLAALNDYIEGRSPRYVAEFRLRHRDGTYRWIYTEGIAERDASGRAIRIFGCHLDVTERHRLEEQLRQSQKLQAIGQLAGGVAHDFNNLLTIITGYSDVLLAEVRHSPAPVGVAIDAIKEAADRAARLTQQLLAFGRNQLLEPKVLDLNGVLSKSEQMLRRLIGEDVRIGIDLDATPAVTRVDPSQIEQVILNLAVNARDAMPRGGELRFQTENVTLDTPDAAELGCTPGRYVRLTVTDNGCGMTPAVKSRAFEPFFTTKPPGSGTGLGLATVYGIVQQSNGVIAVESEVGVGTRFRVWLPACEAEPTPVAPVSLTPPAGRETILLVEDEDAVRTVTQVMLRRAGYTVVAASSGQEAIQVVQTTTQPIDLLVSDVVMPEIGGRELAEKLLQLRPGIKVLFLSGYTADAVVRHGIFQSEVAFLQKPYSPDSLVRKVREVLDGALATA